DGRTLFELRPGTWLGFAHQSFSLRDRRRDLDLELSTEFLPLVRHFLCPRTLDSALLLPGALQGESLAVLQELIDLGLLQPGQSQGLAEPEEAGDIWAHWQDALDFYLGTRTQTATPYISVAQMEEQLAGKALQQRQPSAFKDYFSHPFVALDNPLLAPAQALGQRNLLDALSDRETCRTFDGSPLSARQLSQLLYYTWGASQMRRNPMGDFFLKKTSASGGSLHAIEVYPILLNVQGFEAGLYHYSVRRHGLELLSREDPRTWIGAACGEQDWISKAAVVFLSTARLERLAWKYPSSRALRVALMDCGHLSQSFALVATALGLKSCTTAALRDETFETRLGLDYLREPVFLLNGAGG
ncbi:SagB/ThcOx family dehydrogenase, partial [Pseudomonas protegens]|uniref:SagB/ThcOx family dehydrogenase n=1 Tax=Pseudomonas protegens TaxID=380021 RepID=UPI00223AB3EC